MTNNVFMLTLRLTRVQYGFISIYQENSMPLFNFDDAITAVKTAHAECTQISRDIEANTQARFALNSEQADVSAKLDQLNACGSMTAFNEAEIVKKLTQKKQENLEQKKHGLQAQQNALPKITSRLAEREQLEHKITEAFREFLRVRNQQSCAEATIREFNALPIEKPITEDKLTAYRAELQHQMTTIRNKQRTNLENDFTLVVQRVDAQTALTNAVKALQDQYDQSALTLAVLSTCAVVALVLLEVLTLPVAAPVLLVSLAAIGLWHYNQTTDPEALSNNSPAP